MKAIAALTTATAALTSTIAAGAIFFAPAQTAASFAPAGQSSQIAVNVHDDEGDALKGVDVLVTDANRPGSNPVDTQRSGENGHLQVAFPSSGTYIVHIDTPPDPTEYDEGDDTDKGATYRCGGKVATRCITVQVANGVVHFPGTTSASPATDLEMWFVDRSPEPRVEVFVTLRDTPKQLISGGTIKVAPNQDDPATTDDDPFSMVGTGRTLSKQITSGGYAVTFVPPTGYKLADPANQTRRVTVSHRRPVHFVVVPDASNVGDAGISDEQRDVEHTTVGSGFPIDDLIAKKAPDEDRIAEPTPTSPPAPEAPSADPVDTVPTETVPAETVPADDGLPSQCYALLETYPAVAEIDPGLFDGCATNPAAAITVIDAIRAELGL